jgi:hypothetical protein
MASVSPRSRGNVSGCGIDAPNGSTTSQAVGERRLDARGAERMCQRAEFIFHRLGNTDDGISPPEKLKPADNGKV